MSTTINDTYVSQMQLDSSDFEKAAKEVIETVKQIKAQVESIEASGKAFDALDKAANSVSMSALQKSVTAIQKQFTTLGLVALKVKDQVASSILGTVNKMVGFVEGSIVSGGIRRAMNIENAHFQLQSLLKDEEKVQKIMDNAMESVDGTAYAYDEAAKAASQFAASGVQAGEEMLKALKGIAGVAATTNAEYEGIARIFNTVSGNGRLMGDQLLQLSSRGLNAASTIADYFKEVKGQANMTEATIRELVTKGQISFEIFSDAMYWAFGESAFRANETFTGALSNVKSAFARIGAGFVSPLIEQNSKVVDMFNAIRVKVNEIKKELVYDEGAGNVTALSKQFTDSVLSMAESVTNFVKDADLSVPFDVFYSGVNATKNVVRGLASVLGPAARAFQNVFLSFDNSDIKQFTKSLEDLTAKFKLSEKQSKNLYDTFHGIGSVVKLIVNVLMKFVQAAGFLVNPLLAVLGSMLKITGVTGRALTAFVEWISSIPLFSKAYRGLVFILGKLSSAIVYVIDHIGDFLREVYQLPIVQDIIAAIVKSLGNLRAKSVPYIEKVLIKLRDLRVNFADLVSEKAISRVSALGALFSKLKENIQHLTLADVIHNFKEFKNKLSGLFTVFQTAYQTNGLKGISSLFVQFFQNLIKSINLDSLTRVMSVFRGKMNEFFDWIKKKMEPALNNPTLLKFAGMLKKFYEALKLYGSKENLLRMFDLIRTKVVDMVMSINQSLVTAVRSLIDFIRGIDFSKPVAVFLNVMRSIRNVAKAAISVLLPVLQAVFETFLDITDSDIVGFTSKIEKLTSKLILTGGQSKYLYSIVKQVLRIVKQLVSTVFDFVTSLDVKGIISIVLNGLQSIVNVISFFIQVATVAAGAFNDFFLNAKDNGLVQLSSRIAKLTGNFKLSGKQANNLRDVFKGIFELILKIADKGVSMVEKLDFGKIMDIGIKVFGILKKIGSVIWNILEPGLDAVINFVASDKFLSWVEKAVGWVERLVDAVNPTDKQKEGLGKLFSGVGKWISMTIDLLSKIIDALMPALEKLLPALTDLISAIGEVFGDSIGKLADSISESSTTDKVITSIADAIAYLVTTIADLATALAELIRTGEGLDGFTKAFSGIFDGVKGFFQNLNIGGFTSNVLGNVSGLTSGIKDKFNGLSSSVNLGWLNDIFDFDLRDSGTTGSTKNLFSMLFGSGTIKAYAAVGEEMSETTEGMIDDVNSLQEAVNSVELSGFVEGIGDVVNSVKELGKGDTVAKSIKKTGDILTDFFAGVDLSIDRDALGDKLSGVVDVSNSFISWMQGQVAPVAANLDFGTLLSGLVGVSSIYGLLNATKGMMVIGTAIASVQESLSGILTSIKSIFDGVRKIEDQYAKSMKWDTIANFFVSIGKGIFLLASSLFILSLVKTDKLGNAVAGLWIILITVGGIAALIAYIINNSKQKTQWDFLTVWSKGLTKALNKMAAAIDIAAISMLLGSLTALVVAITGCIVTIALLNHFMGSDLQKALNVVMGAVFAFVAIVAALILLTTAMKAIGNLTSKKYTSTIAIGKQLSHFLDSALAIALMSMALVGVVKALKILFSIDLPNDWTIKLGILVALLGVLSILALTLGNKKWDAAGKMQWAPILAICVGLFILAKGIKSFLELTLPEDWKIKIGILAGAFAGLALLVAVAGKFKGSANATIKAGATLAGLAVFVIAASFAVKILSSTDWKKAIPAATSLAIVLVALGACLKLVGKGTISAGAWKSAMALTVAILAITVALTIMTFISWESILKGVVGLGLILIAFGQALSGAGKIQKGNTAALIVMLASLFVISITLQQLSHVDFKSAFSAGMALKTVLIALGNCFKTIGDVTQKIKLRTVLVFALLVAALFPIAAAISLLATGVKSWESLVAAGFGLSAVLLSLTAAVRVLANTKMKKGNILQVLGLFAAVIVACVPIAGLLYALSGQNPDGLIGAAVALGGLLLALSGTVRILSKSAPMDNNKIAAIISTMIIMVVASIAMTGELVILARQNPLNLIASAIALGGLMTAMAGALWIIGKGGEYNKKKILGNVALMAELVVASLVLTYELIKLSSYDVVSLVGAATALSEIMIALAGAVWIMSEGGKMDGETILGNMALLAGITIASKEMVDPLIELSAYDFTALIGAATALGELMLALAGAVWIMSEGGKGGISLGKGGIQIDSSIALLAELMAFLPSLCKELGDLAARDLDGLIYAATAVGELMDLMAVAVLIMSFSKGVGVGIKPEGLGINSAILLFGEMLLFLPKVAETLGDLAARNLDGLIETATGIGILFDTMAVAVVILSKVSGLSEASSGIIAFAEFILVVGGLATAIGAFFALLEDAGFANPEQFLERGLNVIVDIFGAVGRAVGAIVSGFAAGLFSQLYTIGDDLTKFMEHMQPFFKSLLDIPEGTLGAATELVGILLLFTAAEFLQGLADFFDFFNIGAKIKEGILGEKTGLAKLGEQLAEFAPYIKKFADGVKGINTSEVQAATDVAKTMMGVIDVLPREGGLLQSIIGNKMSLGKLGVWLEDFANGIKSFADSVVGIDISGVENAKTAGMAMIDLLKNMPNTGGALQAFLGEKKDLQSFGNEMNSFGTALWYFANRVKGIDKKSVEGAAAAGELMASLQDKMPSTGGKLQEWFGQQKDLATFGVEMISFGKSLVSFADTVKPLGDDGKSAIENAKSAGDMMADLENSLPSQDGALNKWFFGGNQTLDKFGSNLLKFGGYLVDYAKKVEEISLDTLTNSTPELQHLVEVAKNIDEIDTDSLSSFSGAMKNMAKTGLDAMIKELTGASDKVDKAVATFAGYWVAYMNDQRSSTTSGDTIYKASIWLGESIPTEISNAIYSTMPTTSDTAATILAQNIISKLNSTLFPTTDQVIQGYGKKICTELKKGIENKAKDVYKTIRTICQKVLSLFKKYLPSVDFYNISYNGMKQFEEGFKDKQDDVCQTMEEVAQAIVNTFKDLLIPTTLYEIGKQVAEDFNQGLLDQLDAIMEAAEKMANAVVGTYEKELDINSPSGTMYDDGVFTVQGLMDSLYAYLTALTAVSEELVAEGIVDPINEALNSVPGLLTGALSLNDLVITPVVDLSEVKDSADTISNLLGFSLPLYGLYQNVMAAGNSFAQVYTPGMKPSGDIQEVAAGNIIVNQNNYSPKALDRMGIYRDTQNLTNTLKGLMKTR